MKKALFAICLLIPVTTLAETKLGVIGAKSQSIYKATDSNSVSLPSISYEGENFFLRLPDIGYRFFPRRSFQNVAVGLSYDASTFDPSEANDINMRKLDDRDASVMAFASYRIGFISTKLSQDISGKHDGYSAKIALGFPIPVGMWRIIPSLSYEFMDSKMSNHLFGVSQKESTNTGGAISSYDSGSVSKIQYGVRGVYPITTSTNIMLGVSRTKYDDSILKSPIIERDETTSLLAGVIFSF